MYIRRFILFCIASFSWLGLILFAAFGNVLVKESIYELISIAGLILSFLVCILLFLGAYRNDSLLKKILKKSGYASWVASLGLLLVIPMTITYALAKGVPTIAHFPLATEGTITVTVKGKPDLYLARGCSGTVYLEGYSHLGNHFICGLEQSEWSALKSGDSIELYGTSSKFGFRYTGYKVSNDG